MVFFSVLLSSLWAQVPPSYEGIPPAITEGEVRNFLDEYMSRYMKKDINVFMSFFSKGAIENRLLLYGDIYEIYQKTFDNSDALQYYLEIYSIQIFGQSAYVSGRYKVIQTLKEKNRNKVFQGNIQWYVIRENGSLKIMEMNYGRDR
jgi:hypothetical protein